MKFAVAIASRFPKQQVLWASPRESYNFKQAEDCKVHIITMTNDLIKKVEKFGRELEDVSLDTVKMFYNDALSSGYEL